MMRRPVQRVPNNSCVRKTFTRPSRSIAPQRSYSQSPDSKDLKHKILECKISIHEFSHQYEAWDQIVNECVWHRKCRRTSGHCSPASNCLLNAQVTYLALKSSHKRLAAYEKELAILTYGKEN